MRVTLLGCFALAFAFLFATTPAHANSKYAGLVVDADTGEVLYQDDAGARRYPASLTKMMTLYLTFDAMRKGQINENTRMRASSKAAKQPQTNISLRTGDSITVDQAIRALVVRSANDVSIVLAEHLGGSEWSFAQKMTHMARQLGMTGTVFKNPHGLPNSGQYTTAKDMAKLGIALKRDFPQYYDYFKETEFRWKGRTYKGHNNVMKDYEGVDGIKTGYINASGFNLVTSAHKDGYNLVAVVMGGKTSRSRDDHMKDLLDRNFYTLAQRGDAPRRFANAPTPEPKPRSLEQAIAERPAPPSPFQQASASTQAKVAAKAEERKPITVASLGNNIIKFIPSTKPDTPKPTQSSSNTLDSKLAALQNTSSKPAKGSWAIQVGAFKAKDSALEAASNAINRARTELADARIAISGGGSIHRAQIGNLTQKEAREACKTLRQYDSQCFSFQLGSI